MGNMPGAPDIIPSQLHTLHDRIADRARRAGRAPESIRLIAVSKGHDIDCIEAAMRAGQTEYGESTAQEALPKIDRLRERALTWHFIGRLQSNKAKLIAGNFAWLHSLDSVALAARLERFTAEKSATLDTLIEVNVTQDPRKHGVPPAQLYSLLDSLLQARLTHVRLRGLMTIGPAGASGDAVRACFARLRALRDECRIRSGLAQFTELSMGMSADYAEAIVEGATMIRVGSAIFGERVY